MYLTINNKIYPINITYKNNKNMYLRIKDDLTITITAPKYMSEKRIKEFVNNNIEYITKAIIKKENKHNREEGKLLYLGKPYDIVYTNDKNIIFGNDKVFVGKNVDIDKYYKKLATSIFQERLDMIYKIINDIPYPSLRVRKMKTKWGVCNPKLEVVTLNQELIKYNYLCIDYVIVHELCHFKEANHSSDFWYLVESYMPNYKDAKKILKS